MLVAYPKAPTYKPSTDLAQLLRKVAHRDHSAFAELYRATSAQMTGLVSRIVRRGDASEVVQEAFVRVWEHAATFDSTKGSAMAWMATIARNLALDEIRRVRRSPLEDSSEGFEFPDTFIHPLASRERTEQYVKLMRSLQKLEPQKRDMILLAYYHGATRKALAQRYSAPISTIKTLLRRGLKELRDGLDT